MTASSLDQATQPAQDKWAKGWVAVPACQVPPEMPHASRVSLHSLTEHSGKEQESKQPTGQVIARQPRFRLDWILGNHEARDV